MQTKTDIWSLGCDVLIEDIDTEVQEIKVDDILLSSVFSSEEISVDFSTDSSVAMNLEIGMSINGFNSSIYESQVVPYERIQEINDTSIEATDERKYAASSFAVHKIDRNLKELDFSTQKGLNEQKAELNNQKETVTRGFQDAKEALEMLEHTMLAGFNESISPITVKTMSLLVGDESLQFRFVNSMGSTTPKASTLRYIKESKRLVSSGDSIQHMTLGIDAVAPSHQKHYYWYVNSADIALEDSNKAYFIYIKAAKTEGYGGVGEYVVSETAIEMEAVSGYYHFLTAIINSESNGDRSLAFLNGFTEILPAQITTPVIKDAEGKLIIDLESATITAKDGAKFIGDISFGSGSEGLDNLQVWKDLEKNLSGVEETLENLKDQIDGVVENYFLEGTPTTTTPPVTDWLNGVSASDRDAVLLEHVGDTYTNISTTDETAGYSWRWCECTNIEGVTDYIEVSSPTGNKKLHWHRIADTDAIKALEMASKAQATADGKRRVFTDTPYPPYDKGDLWVQGKSGDMMVCVNPKTAVESFSDFDWEKASKYTDDTTANEAKNLAEEAKKNAEFATKGNLIPNSSTIKNYMLPLADYPDGGSSTYYAKILLPIKVNGGETYTFKCENAQKLSGYQTGYRIRIDDGTREVADVTNVFSRHLYLPFGDNQSVTFTIFDGVVDKVAFLTIIRQESSPNNSRNDSILLNNVSLVRGATPMSVWEDYKGDAGLNNLLLIPEEVRDSSYNASWFYDENLPFTVKGGETYAISVDNLEKTGGTKDNCFAVICPQDSSEWLSDAVYISFKRKTWGILRIKDDVVSSTARLRIGKGEADNNLKLNITRLSLVRGPLPLMEWKESRAFFNKLSESIKDAQSAIDAANRQIDALGVADKSLTDELSTQKGKVEQAQKDLKDIYDKATGDGYISDAEKRAIKDAEDKLKAATEALEQMIDDLAASIENDYGFLRGAFGQITTGDVFLSKLMGVGVKNEGEKDFTVNAFMNGRGEITGTEEEGILMLATGIPATGGSLAERAAQATTRIYENGKIETNELIATNADISGKITATSGTIGNSVQIGTDGIKIDTKEKGSLNISETGIVYNGPESDTVTIGACAGAAIAANGKGGGRMCPSKTYQVGVYASTSKGKAAVFCDRGAYYGFRPRTIVTATNMSLDTLHHTIIVKGSVTLTLPKESTLVDQVEIGQCYRIIVASGSVTINTGSTSHSIFNLVTGKSEGTSISPTTLKMIELVWDGTSTWYLDGPSH